MEAISSILWDALLIIYKYGDTCWIQNGTGLSCLQPWARACNSMIYILSACEKHAGRRCWAQHCSLEHCCFTSAVLYTVQLPFRLGYSMEPLLATATSQSSPIGYLLEREAHHSYKALLTPVENHWYRKYGPIQLIKHCTIEILT